jgi:hypothetical protein
LFDALFCSLFTTLETYLQLLITFLLLHLLPHSLPLRDTEIDELRGQLSRMQEDWIEEECHRVEAQLALKDARHEIQQLKDVVETVHNSLSDAGGLSGDEGVQKFFMEINAQNHKLENLLL